VLHDYPAEVQQIAMKYRVSLTTAAMLLLLMQGSPAHAAEGGRMEDRLGYADVGNRKFIPRDESPQPEPEIGGRPPPPMHVFTAAEKAQMEQHNRPKQWEHTFGNRLVPRNWDAWVEGLRESENVEDQRVGPEKSDD
jgi:hypothetical protein